MSAHVRPGWMEKPKPATQAAKAIALLVTDLLVCVPFLGLLLPADHAVWTALEEPGPVYTGDRYLALPQPGRLLHSTATDGIVRLVNHGSDRQTPADGEDNPHYARFACASAAAPGTPPDGDPPGPENQFTLLICGRPSLRARIHPLYARGRQAASWNTPHVPEAREPLRTSTLSVVHGPWEARVHRIEAPAGTILREGRWAVADDLAPPAATTGPGWATTRRGDRLTSALAALHGWEGQEPCRGAVGGARGHNAYGRHSATPVLTSVRSGGTKLLATLVVLTADPAVLRDAQALHAGAHAVMTDEGVLEVTFPDGRTEQVAPPDTSD